MLLETELQWIVDLSLQPLHLWTESDEEWYFWEPEYSETGWTDLERHWFRRTVARSDRKAETEQIDCQIDRLDPLQKK